MRAAFSAFWHRLGLRFFEVKVAGKKLPSYVLFVSS